MFGQIGHVTHGYLIWLGYKLRFRLDQHTVLLVLTGKDRRLDTYALIHLGHYVERKIADRAVILTADGTAWEQASKIPFPFAVEVYRVKEQEISLLYDYYCFEEYLDNVVFTYIDRPKDNLLGRLLRETDIDEEEAVCLGCYCLRSVPRSGIERKDGDICIRANMDV